MFAGVLIGIAGYLYLSVGGIYGSIIFALALLYIVEKKIPLFTGRVGKYPLDFAYINKLIIWLALNFVGVTIMALVARGICNNAMMEQVVSIVEKKFASNDYLSLFAKGLGCGALMFIGVTTKDKFVTIFCVSGFILAGFEHCVADAFYMAFAYMSGWADWLALAKLLVIVLGNGVAAVGLAMFTHFHNSQLKIHNS